MSARDKRLEQAQPKGDSPAKINKRKFGSKPAPRFTGVKGVAKPAQHRAKPGMTSPQ